MAKNMMPYYLSRTIFSLLIGVFLLLTGSTVWVSVLTSALILAFFLWAPHSGRYAVHPELGVTALRRDERTQYINDKAARNAFVISMLAAGAFTLYFGLTGAAMIPISILKILLGIGVLAYFISDLWLRRVQE